MARDLRPSGVAEMGARPEKSWTTAPHLRQDRQPRLHFREGDKGPQRRCARRGQAAVGAPPQTPVKASTPLAFVREEAEAPWVVRVPVGRRPYGVGFERKQALGTRQRRKEMQRRKTEGGRRRREASWPSRSVFPSAQQAGPVVVLAQIFPRRKNPKESVHATRRVRMRWVMGSHGL